MESNSIRKQKSFIYLNANNQFDIANRWKGILISELSDDEYIECKNFCDNTLKKALTK